MHPFVLSSRTCLVLCTWLALASWPGAAYAQAEPDKSNKEGAPTPVNLLVREVAMQNEALAKSQKKVSEARDEGAALLAEYRAVTKRNDALRQYNAQLEALLASQRAEHEAIEQRIERMTVVSRQITPLMLRMLDALEDLVRVDAPFLRRERRERVRALRALMSRADVSESEKFRRVLEAYQIENEYGRTLEAYDDVVELDGEERSVHVLRVGRVALLCTSLDGKRAYRWDRASRRWVALRPEEARDLPKAFRMARKQGAPDLIRIPVPAPEKGGA